MANQVIIDKSKLTNLGDKIRSKTGGTSALKVDQMASEIEEKLVLPNGNATADKVLSGYTFHSGSSIAKKTGTIATKTSSDLTVNGATVSVPAGYYNVLSSKSVATATQATPSISVNSSGLITATSIQSEGYVSAGTKSATKQLSILSADDLTVNGAKISVPSGYYVSSEISKSVATATQATPTISVDSSTGVITASATQSEGYVASGTKSATEQLTTKGATTYTPTTSNQTISAGTYLTGKITIKGDADLKAENIKKGVNIFGVVGTYETPIDLDDITTMSWQQLSELSSKGVDLSSCLGQTKDITVSGSTISARLVSMKYNGTKGYVFMTSEVLPTQYKMQTNSTTKTSGGWANTTFKTTLEGTIYNSINSDLRSYMKSVTVPYTNGDGNYSAAGIGTLSAKIFVPSVRELKGASGSYTSLAEGTQFDYFANGGSFTVGNNFFTRTRTTINQFAYFLANSSTVGQIWFNTSAYVLFCFVI